MKTAETHYDVFRTCLFVAVEGFDKISAFDRFMSEEYISETFHLFSMDVGDCASQLSKLPLSTHFESIFCETFFSEMLRLPNMHSKVPFYVALMIKVLESHGDNLSLPLGRCVNFMYQNLSKMDVQCLFTLCEWSAKKLLYIYKKKN